MTTEAIEQHASEQAMAALSSMPAGEFLTFRIEAVEYGIDIAGVREVRGRERIVQTVPTTAVAGEQAAWHGTFDLRGAVVPVLDLRAVNSTGPYGLAQADAVIVLGRSAPVAGIAVDSVRDVLTLLPGDVRPLVEAAVPLDVACALGRGARDERSIVVIDLACVLARAGIALT